MKKRNQLTKRQQVVINALVSTDKDEQAILAEHKVSRATFAKWLAEPAFLQQFELRSAMAYRRSRAMIAHHAPEAANRLIYLAKEGKGETARKACLDIISMGALPAQSPPSQAQDGPTEPPDQPPLPPETAARLLAILAEKKNRTKTG
jgi:hypothetical protein